MWIFKDNNNNFVVPLCSDYKLYPESLMVEFRYAPFIVFQEIDINYWINFFEKKFKIHLTIFKIELHEYE